MSKKENLVQRLLSRPKDMRFAEIVRILESCGWKMLKRGSGSHRKFAKPGGGQVLTIPETTQPVKRNYIEDVILALGLEEDEW